MERIQPLLSALASTGAGAAACVGKAVALQAQKKAISTRRLATGLETIITTMQQQHQQQQGQGQDQQQARTQRLQLQGAWSLLREVRFAA